MSRTQEFHDIALLARDRCRADSKMALQLLDDERERAALLMAVAADMIYSACSYLPGDRRAAMQLALNTLVDMLRAIEGLPPKESAR